MAETENINAVDIIEGQHTQKQLGKFNTAEELLCAYNALESEFTKRCQLIKQLQAELSLLRAQADARQSAEGGEECAHAAPDALGEAVESAEDKADSRREKPIVEGESSVPNAPCADASDNHAVSDEILLCAAEYADVLSGIPEIMTACITRYKQKLIESRASGSPAGMAVIVPAKRPRTLADAKRLADEMLA